jgi:hypothetical protein
LAEAPGKWRRLKGLSAWQWKVLLASPFILLLTWFRLRSGGYNRTLTLARPEPGPRLPPRDMLTLARETAYPLAAAIKYGPWMPRCLVRSLALGWFLGRQGIPFEVRIGLPGGKSIIGTDGKLNFSAHAWVEVGGVVLNDREDIAQEYRSFDT